MTCAKCDKVCYSLLMLHYHRCVESKFRCDECCFWAPDELGLKRHKELSHPVPSSSTSNEGFEKTQPITSRTENQNNLSDEEYAFEEVQSVDYSNFDDVEILTESHTSDPLSHAEDNHDDTFNSETEYKPLVKTNVEDIPVVKLEEPDISDRAIESNHSITFNLEGEELTVDIVDKKHDSLPQEAITGERRKTSFRNKNKLFQSLKTLSSSKQSRSKLRCTMCSFKAPNFAILNKHKLRLHSLPVSSECVQTPRIFLSENDPSGESIKTAALTLECEKCGRGYRTRRSLTFHQRNMCGKEPQFSCSHCPYRAYQKVNLKSHLWNTHQICVDIKSIQKGHSSKSKEKNKNPSSNTRRIANPNVGNFESKEVPSESYLSHPLSLANDNCSVKSNSGNDQLLESNYSTTTNSQKAEQFDIVKEFAQDAVQKKNKLTMKCGKCKRVFKSRVTLCNHECSMSSLKCHICSFHAQNLTGLKQHRRLEHSSQEEREAAGIGSFPCENCSKVFTRKDTLRKHQQFKCGKEPQFQCPYCPYKTYYKYALKVHVLKKHPTNSGEVRVSCDGCTRSYKNISDLRRHQRLKKCGKVPLLPRQKTVAMKRKLGTNTRHLHAGSGQTKRFSCGRCGRSFPRNCNLLRHHRTTKCGAKLLLPAEHCVDNSAQTTDANNSTQATGADNLTQTTGAERLQQRQLFPCKRCGGLYKSERSLSRHVRYECGQEKRFTCPLCPYRCKRQYNLKHHIARHASQPEPNH